jgi:sulfite reductase beta subunit-like hemoprotein
MRNVMSCTDAGVGLDEPFDCLPDARMVSDAILARSAELNCTLPSRLNFTFGGCPRCAEHARVNDLGFESRVVGGRCGYRLWAGGSLGTMPVLAMPLREFVPRESVLPAAEALVDVFVAHGDFDNPKRARMKFLVAQLGEDGFRHAFDDAFIAAEARPHPAAAELDHVADANIDQILRSVPDGGWGSGVRPQRVAGLAMVTVNVPLGDLNGDDLRVLADVAETTRDGHLNLTRNQNVQYRDVPIARVGQVRKMLATRHLSFIGADAATDVRVCTGSSVCSLGITDSPSVGIRLTKNPALERNASLRVHISGCPNSCAQHQMGDIGFSGAKVRIGGRTQLGYHMYLGADVGAGKLAQVVGRVGEDNVDNALEAVIGGWEALRAWGETFADTLERIGIEAFAAHLSSITDGFEPGDDELGDAEHFADAVAVGT